MQLGFLAVLVAADPAMAQVADAAFSSEYVALGTSPAIRYDDGLVLEAQAQVMPGFGSPTGLALIPVVPRLAVGMVGHKGFVTWGGTAHGFGMVSSDAEDRGGGAGVSGGVALGAPGGRLRTGVEGYGQWFGFRSFDDRYAQWTLGLDLSSGYDVDPVTVLFRFGTAVGSLRSDTTRRGVRVEPYFQPRFAVGASWKATPQLTVALMARMALRELIPRVPWSPVASVSYRIP